MLLSGIKRGATLSEATYSNGLRHGVYRKFIDGAVLLKENYFNDMRDGTSVLYLAGKPNYTCYKNDEELHPGKCKDTE